MDTSALTTCSITWEMAVGTMFMVGFDRVLLLYMPKTYKVADCLYTYTYRMAFTTNDYGIATVWQDYEP